MNRILSILIALALVAAVGAAIILPRLNSDGGDGPKTRSVEVMGLGAASQGEFFADRDVKAALAKAGLRVSYDDIESAQIDHALRFEDYGFVWPATEAQKTQVMGVRPGAKDVDAVSTRLVLAATPAEAERLRTAGIAKVGADGSWQVDATRVGKVADGTADGSTAVSDFLDNDGSVGIVKALEQPLLMRSDDLLAMKAVIMYPASADSVSMPLLALDADGQKLGRELEENERLAQLLVKYGWRTGDDSAFRSAWKSIIAPAAVKAAPAA
jgi:hypothetical protein